MVLFVKFCGYQVRDSLDYILVKKSFKVCTHVCIVPCRIKLIQFESIFKLIFFFQESHDRSFDFLMIWFYKNMITYKYQQIFN